MWLQQQWQQQWLQEIWRLILAALSRQAMVLLVSFYTRAVWQGNSSSSSNSSGCSSDNNMPSTPAALR